jgi:predicted DNA-binding transcriptional regulator YafY
MPANLNALIRYKTINDLLSARRNGCTIDQLVDACSDALAEITGNYSGVSERTIRDDLRVMRSDILGFNAPIVSKNGKYFYSNPNYSLRNILISDHDLAQKIFLLFEKYLDRLEDPDAVKVLKRLKEKIDRMKRLSEIEYNEYALESNIPGLMTFKVSEKAKANRELMFGHIFSLITSLKPKSR